jgi:hypothetical protein
MGTNCVATTTQNSAQLFAPVLLAVGQAQEPDAFRPGDLVRAGSLAHALDRARR